MKKLSAIALAAICLSSCSQKIIEIEENPKLPTPKRIESLVIGDPLDCGIENRLMFPIGTSYRPEVIEPPAEVDVLTWTSTATDMNFSLNTSAYKWDSNALTEYVNNTKGDFDITNILFFDIETGESYPLVGEEDTIHILSFAIHKEFENPLIFYRVVREDYNNDSVFDALDPVALYVSPLDGDTLIQVTPDSEQFADYFYYRDSQKILVKTRIDADNDSLFSPMDETTFVQMELRNPAFGKPLFSAALKADLKGKLNL
ncbi:MAG: hypothetical protein ACI857_001348 [Arenicella sp.]|jgi:hypothetical protein